MKNSKILKLLIPILLFSFHLHANPEKTSWLLTFWRYFFPKKQLQTIAVQKPVATKISTSQPKPKIFHNLMEEEEINKKIQQEEYEKSCAKKHKKFFNELMELKQHGKPEDTEKLLTMIENDESFVDQGYQSTMGNGTLNRNIVELLFT